MKGAPGFSPQLCNLDVAHARDGGRRIRIPGHLLLRGEFEASEGYSIPIEYINSISKIIKQTVADATVNASLGERPFSLMLLTCEWRTLGTAVGSFKVKAG